MPSTKMFRDRVVSMEQTYEQGEKHLTLLQTLVAEALPGYEFRGYQLDHEHDLFVMLYGAPDGSEKKISWTRMMLYDAERIPADADNAIPDMRGKIVEFLRRRADRREIDVTFRHLEDGWVDTPEPRKSRGRRGRGGERRGGGAAPPAPAKAQGRPGPPGRPGPSARPGPPGRPAPPARPSPPSREAARQPVPEASGEPGGPKPSGRRRMRRRRGRRRGGGGTPPATPPAGAPE